MDLNGDLLGLAWGNREGALPPSAGRVVGGHAPSYRVWNSETVAEAHLPGRFRTLPSRMVPVVGDWVELSEDRRRITGVLPRTSLITRESTSAEALDQVLAANADVVAVVLLPSHRGSGLLLNFLSVAWSSQAAPIVCWGKADSSTEEEMEQARQEALQYVGTDSVFAISAHSGEGVPELEGCIGTGATAAFLGPSGVGKSSLINAMAGTPVRQTGGVDRTGQGRHVSSDRALLPGRTGCLLLDTPGLRTVLAAEAAGTEQGFPDIVALAGNCRFRDCRHEAEPGCAVTAAIDTGELSPHRIEEYRKLERDSRRIELRRDLRAQAEAHAELVVRARKARKKFRRP